MKKMTIEEKAEAYDEAIERAKKVLLDCTSEEQKVVEYITPELKESEDERIKKAIIATIHLYYGEPIEDEAKDMIAWLEKQGEQKLPIEKLPFEMKTPEESLGIATGTYSKIVDECIYGEQKSAWSEEDEKIILSIEQVMNCASLLNLVPEKIDKIRTWLKSLRPQKQWKPSDEQLKQLGKYCIDNTALTSLYEYLKQL